MNSSKPFEKIILTSFQINQLLKCNRINILTILAVKAASLHKKFKFLLNDSIQYLLVQLYFFFVDRNFTTVMIYK